MKAVKEGVEEEGKKEASANEKEREGEGTESEETEKKEEEETKEENEEKEEEEGKEIGVTISDKVNTSVEDEGGEGSRGTWHFYANISYSVGTNKLYLLPSMQFICKELYQKGPTILYFALTPQTHFGYFCKGKVPARPNSCIVRFSVVVMPRTW